LSSQNIAFFFFQAEDGIRDRNGSGVQTCALPICPLPCTRRTGWPVPPKSKAVREPPLTGRLISFASTPAMVVSEKGARNCIYCVVGDGASRQRGFTSCQLWGVVARLVTGLALVAQSAGHAHRVTPRQGSARSTPPAPILHWGAHTEHFRAPKRREDLSRDPRAPRMTWGFMAHPARQNTNLQPVIEGPHSQRTPRCIGTATTARGMSVRVQGSESDVDFPLVSVGHQRCRFVAGTDRGGAELQPYVRAGAVPR